MGLAWRRIYRTLKRSPVLQACHRAYQRSANEPMPTKGSPGLPVLCGASQTNLLQLSNGVNENQKQKMKRGILKRKPYTLKRKTKLRKRGKSDLSKKDAELWTSFSFFVRERDNWTCYTCGKSFDKTDYTQRINLHAGHFISRRIAITRFHPLNVRAQRRMCNFFGYGQSPRFAQRLIREHGQEVFNELVDLSRRTHQWTVKELEHLIGVLKTRPSDYESEYYKLLNQP